MPGYRASSDGRILGKLGAELSQQFDRGYYRVMVAVKEEGRRYVTRKTVRVNRLVCEAFHGHPPTPKHEAAHSNGDSLDNRYTNLEWQTKAENLANPVTIRRFFRTWSEKAMQQ